MFSRGMSFKFKLRFKGRINQTNRIMCSISCCKQGKRKLTVQGRQTNMGKGLAARESFS